MNKYRNNRTQVDGIEFDSAKESRRYCELKLLQRAGVIKNLELQVSYCLKVQGIHITKYDVDFQYIDARTGLLKFEDVKPTFKTEKARKAYHATAAYRMFALKKKLMLACNNIEVIEI